MRAPPADPKRILLIRLSAFGDIVIATALLNGLRRAYPEAEIDWLVQPEFAELLRTQPAIANVIPWPRKDWGRLWRSLRWFALWRAVTGFRRSLRQRDYDCVIDAQGLAKSRLLAWLAGGRFRIGYSSKEPFSGLMDAIVRRDPEAHVGRRAIGAEHAPMLMALAGRSVGGPVWSATDGPGSGADILLAPFTTRPQKHWPEEHWQQLIGTLLGAGYSLAVLGGPADAHAADRLVQAHPGKPVRSLAGKTAYAELGSVIAPALGLVGVDTGLTHLAIVLGVPTVALFGSTLPYRQGTTDGNVRTRVLWMGLSCSPCGRKPGCDGRWDCLRALTPGQVGAAIEEVIQGYHPRRSTKNGEGR